MNRLHQEFQVFLRRLEATRLLSQDQWQNTQQLAASLEDLKSFAQALRDREWLTSWQLKPIAANQLQLVRGRYALLDQIGQGGMGTDTAAVDESGLLAMESVAGMKRITDESAEVLGSLVKLQSLEICGNSQLLDTTAQQLGRMEDLGYVCATQTRVTDESVLQGQLAPSHLVAKVAASSPLNN